MNQDAPTVDIDDITVRYGRVPALTNTTLALYPGRVCGLVGMNGSGKSTLFKSIMGLVTPASGRIRVLGEPAERARKTGQISYVPQSEAIDWAFPISVREVVMTGRYGRMGFLRRPGRRDQAAVDEALARVELTDLAGRQIGDLSGGQRKRVFVARGLAQGASILLLDEPFAGVDKRTEATITEVLTERARAGATVLVSTHDLQALPRLADETVLLQRRVIAQGPPETVITTENLIRAFGVDPLAHDRED